MMEERDSAIRAFLAKVESAAPVAPTFGDIEELAMGGADSLLWRGRAAGAGGRLRRPVVRLGLAAVLVGVVVAGVVVSSLGGNHRARAAVLGAVAADQVPAGCDRSVDDERARSILATATNSASGTLSDGSAWTLATAIDPCTYVVAFSADNGENARSIGVRRDASLLGETGWVWRHDPPASSQTRLGVFGIVGPDVVSIALVYPDGTKIDAVVQPSLVAGQPGTFYLFGPVTHGELALRVTDSNGDTTDYRWTID